MTPRLRELIDERKNLAKKVKRINVSFNKNSKFYYTIQNIIKKPRNISREELNVYEKKYSVSIPKDVSGFLIKYGSNGYLNHSVIDYKTDKIWRPEFYMNDEFFKKAILNKINDEILDDFSELYKESENIFKNKLLDKIYEDIGRNYNQIHKLLYLGRSDCGSGDFLCLEGEFKGLIVHSGTWASKNFQISGIKYSKYHYNTFGKSYFNYLEEMFESANSYLKKEIKMTV